MAPPPVVCFLAASLLHRRRWPSVVLALLAGLAAAAPMAIWAAGRLTAGTVQRSLELARAADAFVTVCPPEPASDGQSDPSACLQYRPHEELAAIRSLSGVSEATQAGLSLVRVGTSPDPATWRSRALISVEDRVSYPTVLGHPKLVAGRAAAEDAPNELMANESTARSLGLRPGTRVWMGATEDEDRGPQRAVQSTVVGIVRTAADLLPLQAESIGVPPLHVRAGWSRSHAEEISRAQTVIFVWLDDGDLDGFTTRLQALLGDRQVAVSPTLPPDERENLEQATSFESGAALAVAAVAAFACLFFLGQTVTRQGRSESEGLSIALMLGMTRSQLAAAAGARWLPVALGAALVAVVTALATSALGPAGLARRAPWEPGLRVDALVLGAGAGAVALSIVACGALTAYRTRTSVEATAAPRGPRRMRGSPSIRAGVALACRSLQRNAALPVVSAFVGTALAVAAVVAANGSAATLRRVTEVPERFGAPWDALVGGEPVPEQQAALLASLVDVPGVVAAASIPGNTVMLQGEELWIQAMVPVDGVDAVRAVISAGREPMADDEIALGSITMRNHGIEVGDRIPLQSQLLGSGVRPYRVVGVTMVSDGYEPNVGKGGLVSLSGLKRIAPESSVDAGVDVVVRVTSGPGRASALDAVRKAFPHAVIPFPVPSSLANARRISGLPVLLGVGAAAVAAATLTHALIVSVRRNRRQLAVYRVLGFTRAQVYGAVATQAMLTGAGAAVTGALLGMIGARVGWRLLADSLGVARDSLVPVGPVLVSVMAVVVVANSAAAMAARTAVNLRAATVLHAE